MARLHRNGFPPAVPCRQCLGLDLGAALGPRAFAAARRVEQAGLARARDAVGLRRHHRRGLPAHGRRQLDRPQSAARQRAGRAVPGMAGARGLPGSRPSGLPAGGHRRPGLLPVGRGGAGALGLADAQQAQLRRALAAGRAGIRPSAVPDGRRLRRLPGPDALLQRRPAQHGRADPADRAPRAALLRQARRGRPGHSAAYPERPLAARGRRGRHRAAADRRAQGRRAGAGRQRPDRAGPVAGLETLGRAACRCCGSCTPATWA